MDCRGGTSILVPPHLTITFSLSMLFNLHILWLIPAFSNFNFLLFINYLLLFFNYLLLFFNYLLLFFNYLLLFFNSFPSTTRYVASSLILLCVKLSSTLLLQNCLINICHCLISQSWRSQCLFSVNHISLLFGIFIFISMHLFT